MVALDSAMVYRGLDIGTAKPSAAVRERVPHHLVDIVEPNDAYSAAVSLATRRRQYAASRLAGGCPCSSAGRYSTCARCARAWLACRARMRAVTDAGLPFVTAEIDGAVARLRVLHAVEVTSCVPIHRRRLDLPRSPRRRPGHWRATARCLTGRLLGCRASGRSLPSSWTTMPTLPLRCTAIGASSTPAG